ncbi:MAG TPA: Mpo1-like protein [Reyranella sp.]|nr:Mpo1-like protein [Reyranella sp.]
MPSDFFRRQLASYASVHRSGRNKATHFVGIPMIVFSLLLILALWRVHPGGREVSMALIIAAIAVLGWMALDLGIGLIMAAIMLPTWYAAEALVGALVGALGPSSTVVAFLVLFVGGWILQFIGHYYEGKRPALVDNIFQGFIGPMFLVAETLVAAGYRADLGVAMGEGAMGEGDVTAR